MPLQQGTAARRSGRHVLIIVQNLPVPFDRRVWLECQALRSAGYEVSVVCPKGRGDPSFQVMDGVTIYKYPARTGQGGLVGYLYEYVYSFVATAVLVARAWRRRRIDVVQACNPPDIFWPIALALRPFGCRFVFDHHDLCPELYESRFPEGRRLPYAGLRALEWCTFRSAHRVVSTNASYRQLALERGGKKAGEVTVVRTGPDPSRMERGDPDPALRKGRTFLAAYIGVMGPQDGVDVIVEAAAKIVHDWGRTDITFVLMGSGDSFDELTALRDRLGMADHVEFLGRVPDETVRSVLSTADVGLSPDRKNPLNDLSTMNKTMEYMAFSLPVVAFDLKETRVSAGEAGVYAEPNEVESFAGALVELLDDPVRRSAMGSLARTKVVDELAWSHQREAYLGVYRDLLGEPTTTSEPAVTVASRAGSNGVAAHRDRSEAAR